ncbi:hypothetical protein ERO13_A01G048751v2 [Gossypium hirsutum]|nr:hypothetical protein ERO13_A01G048751v2 [Gossypium hirsutum]
MLFPPLLVFASIFSACCLATSTLGATLAKDEVEALESIGETLGKTNWKFSVDPCSSGDESWAKFAEKGAYYVNNVTCDCSSSPCHIVRIVLKGQNLSGTLPPQVTRLPYLQEMQLYDLSRNYLSGSIPRQWGSMQQLVQISLLGNRLTGSIPEELANISNLTSLVLEHNNFSGNLPAALGNLPKIERFFLNSNNFIGELPETFARLTTLKEFRIGDNNFTGKIPGFIFQNWTNLTDIYIIASGLSGPIPDIVSSGNLKNIIISDLNGAESQFSQLSNLSNLEILILRSCNLIGELPTSLNHMSSLRPLEKLISLPRAKHLILAGNMFTGAVPQWILDTNQIIKGGVDDCQKSGLNLFASTSRINNSFSLMNTMPNIFFAASIFLIDELFHVWETLIVQQNVSRNFMYCLTMWSPWHYLYINCGGRVETIDNITYEADGYDDKLSTFHRSTTHWAFSGTDFTDGKNYRSLGRRIFDVYIQGKRALKDFNIKDEAGGVGKPILKNFTANVSDGTLEIRLQWAGKGTTSIPERGVFGPLISAISIFDPAYKPRKGSGGGISAAAEVGIVAAAIFATFLIVGGILWWSGCLRRRSTLERDLKGIELQTSCFTLRQIKDSTNNFDAANKIGEGGFGPVYKEIASCMISALQHPHLVKLYGCCIEGNQLLLIYEYLENNSLARALFGPEEFQLTLDWPTRRKICIGIARGLAYLHEESRLKIVHRDIKATNVLLDKDLNPKISDFGLAKLDEEDNTHISTRIAGTYGYMAPEYAIHGRLTDKADVYSFGIVALEIVSGTCNTKHGMLNEKPDSDIIIFAISVDFQCRHLLDRNNANTLKQKGNLLDLIDPRVASHCDPEEAMTMINVALVCTNSTAAARPSMSTVVSILKGKASFSNIITNSSIYGSELNPKKLYENVEESDVENNSLTKRMLGDGQWTSSSDLYPVGLTSSYWQNSNSTSTN